MATPILSTSPYNGRQPFFSSRQTCCSAAQPGFITAKLRMMLSRMQGWFLFFLRGTVPLVQLRSCVVSTLREVELDSIGLVSGAHRVVVQDEFAQLGLIHS